METKNARRTDDKMQKLVEKFGRFSFTIESWSFQQNRIEKHFDIFGLPFAIEIFPIGFHGESEFVSVVLRNLGSQDIFAKYKLIIISRLHPNLEWSDPDGTVLFMSNSSDSCWGNYELCSRELLMNEINGFYSNDSITFEVEISVFVTDEYCRSINITLEEACLDLNEFIRKMKTGRSHLNEEKSKQDKLIKTRFT